MREIRVKDTVSLRTPTGDAAVGVVTEIVPQTGILVIEVTHTRTTRYRRSPMLVELFEPTEPTKPTEP